MGRDELRTAFPDVSPEMARQIDLLHDSGPVTGYDRPMARTTGSPLTEQRQVYGDPIINLLRGLQGEDRTNACAYIKAKFCSIEDVDYFPPAEVCLRPTFPHLELRTYIECSGITDAEAQRIGDLMLSMLRHDPRAVPNSGGWANME